MGWYQAKLGNHLLAATLDSIGFAQHGLGDLEAAPAGRWPSAADTLDHIADIEEARGERDAAGRSWRETLAILEDLDHPDAGKVRAKLRTTEGSA